MAAHLEFLGAIHSGGAVNLAGKRLENLNTEREKKINRKRDLEDGLPESVDPGSTREFIQSRWEGVQEGLRKRHWGSKKEAFETTYSQISADRWWV